jgi:alpha-glucosidase
MPFNFALLSAAWNARAIEKIVAEYEQALPKGVWPNWVLGNHDLPRVASRVGGKQARVAAMLLLTLRGTPTLYYGDEIGMRQVPIPPDQARDPFEKNVPGIGVGRDGCRTPMQWDSTANAGFSTVPPWLPLADDAIHANVRNLEAESTSILSLYKALIGLRRRSPALIFGSYEPITSEKDLLIYRRSLGDSSMMIVLNFSDDAASLETGAIGLRGEILLSSFMDRTGEKISGALDLRAHEGLVTALASS